MAAHEDVGVHRPEKLDELVVGRYPCVDRLVGIRGRVTDQHVAKSVDVELHRQRPCGRNRKLGLAKTRHVPIPERAVGGSYHIESIGVPVHGERTHFREKIEDLGRPWPAEAVTRDDDRINLLTLDVPEHGLERREVSVDVADRGDVHVREASARARAAAPRRRDRAPGSPRRRTRSGSDGSRLPECEQSHPRARPRALTHPRP